jgi:hypothetical protein
MARRMTMKKTTRTGKAKRPSQKARLEREARRRGARVIERGRLGDYRFQVEKFRDGFGIRFF